MTWLQRYRMRHYVANSIWVLPLLSMVAALMAIRLLHWLENGMGWESSIDADTARAVLGTLASSMFTFIVFICSALLVVVQLASTQLSPRIIAILFKDPITRISLAVFVFTFTFTLAALVRVTAVVPLLTPYLSAYSCLASLCIFLYLVDHAGKALRPSGALRAVAAQGRRVIESVYPMRLAETPGSEKADDTFPQIDPDCIIPTRLAGVVLAFDIPGLVSLAQRSDCVIELSPQVGDFVAVGDPLFRIFGKSAALSVEALYQSVAVGQERTLEQDPAFAFRILVDIASKGLSPAINDPTTAVLTLDQIHHLLHDVGSRRLNDERIRDRASRLRLVYRTPDWEDYVHLAVTEIRQFGGNSIQVARRMRAMLENLIQTLPDERAALLRQELKMLQRSARRFFTDPDDLALADVGDFQGVGGKKRHGIERRNDEAPPP